MAFRFRSDESLDEAIRRVVREEIDSALAHLGKSSGNRHEHIHEARKSLKKIRAVIRLARPVLGELAREENFWYRDTARTLSSVRDAQAIIESLDKLKRRHPRRRPKQVAAIREGLVARRDALFRAEVDLEATAAAARDRLTIARARIETWPPFPEDFESIGGVVRIYARGRRLRQRAAAAPTSPTIHEWRKRVKDLWYHVRLLQESWPELMTGLEETLGRLSEVLGDHHDLEMLRSAIVSETERFAPTDVAPVLPNLAKRQELLAEDAQRLGRLVYAERTSRFSDRIERYWDAWRTKVPRGRAAGVTRRTIR